VLVKDADLGRRVRQTWDAAARTGNSLFLGSNEPADVQQPADVEVERMFGLVAAERGGNGTCLEVGCGDGRMTVVLAQRWKHVLAVDVSPEMLRRASARALPNVTFRLVSGLTLDGVADACADQIVCYAVMQHFPTTRLIADYVSEFARVLRPSGEAIVHLPVIPADVASRTWRGARRLAIAARPRSASDFSRDITYMGTRLTERELDAIVRQSGLRVAARAELDSYFARARSSVLRLTF
jgi:SAM-dependent methyltransferase